MPEKPRNVGTSVRQRLLNLARASGLPLELLLTRYALERLFHRLSISAHRDRFVLKGALLLTTWFEEPHRATRDLDLLGFGDPSEEALLAVFRQVMAIPVDDGVNFDTTKLLVQPIREELEYGGSRLCTTAALVGARIPIVVDIGFGDAIEPGAEDIDLPVLLEMPSPHLRAYPQETVIAEKLHAMVVLGMANSRMKDFYDVWMLQRGFEIDAGRLQRAIEATFARRSTDVPATTPEGLSDAFATDPSKQKQWEAFARNLSASAPSLRDVVGGLVFGTRERYRLVHHDHAQLRRVGMRHKSGHTVDLQRGDLTIFVSPVSRGVDAHHHEVRRAVHGLKIRPERGAVPPIRAAQARPQIEEPGCRGCPERPGQAPQGGPRTRVPPGTGPGGRAV